MNIPQPELQILPASETTLGEGLQIRRALPTRLRRTVGPWVFLDHFGPVDIQHSDGMRVAPHPHIGLQTVTWLYEGEILHRDSLGSVQLIRPGQLNLMSSGRGISHSEESPRPHPPELHGLQFWIALPDAQRQMAPRFDHYARLPQLERDGFDITVIAGAALGERSPALLFSDAVGMDLSSQSAASTDLPLDPAFEYAVLLTQGEAEVAGQRLHPAQLLYLGGGRSEIRISSDRPVRLALIGGRPIEHPVVMWWNFVARTREELTQAARDWNAGADYFGQVHGYDGDRLPSPMPPWA